MLHQVAIGSALLFVTTLIHAGCTIAALWALRVSQAAHRGAGSRSARELLTSALVVMMFYASLVESLIWASTYLAVGAISGLEKARVSSASTSRESSPNIEATLVWARLCTSV